MIVIASASLLTTPASPRRWKRLLSMKRQTRRADLPAADEALAEATAVARRSQSRYAGPGCEKRVRADGWRGSRADRGNK